ncbi:hypothetical protein DPMN_047892 [Dreissena polymorpha]|uniref:Uncharacterized protein n=1 Tax=Dreissena polymorpha TaxID=45954 RepID=A0A9D4I2B4_DREPO|nr:hypothetical protein DPMN_047892 [Dreissena polymorpha]
MVARIAETGQCCTKHARLRDIDALVLQPDEYPHDSPQVEPLSIPDPRNNPIINQDTGYRTLSGRLVIDNRKYGYLRAW